MSSERSIVTRVGLISDTHGLLRPEAFAFLEGCQHIIHAGDIGGEEILLRLAELAPVTAVRGNNDHGKWAREVPGRAVLRVGRVAILVIHDLAHLDPGVMHEDALIVVSGHSHIPKIQERDGRLFVNPGSAGPRRFTLPVSAGEVIVTGSSYVARNVDLLSGNAV